MTNHTSPNKYDLFGWLGLLVSVIGITSFVAILYREELGITLDTAPQALTFLALTAFLTPMISLALSFFGREAKRKLPAITGIVISVLGLIGSALIGLFILKITFIGLLLGR